MKSGWKYLKQEEFDLIKSLLETGKKISEVAKFMNRSEATILDINKSNNLAAYHDRGRARRNSNSKKVSPTPPTSLIAVSINDRLRSMEEKLDIIITNQNALAEKSRGGLFRSKNAAN